MNAAPPRLRALPLHASSSGAAARLARLASITLVATLAACAADADDGASALAPATTTRDGGAPSPAPSTPPPTGNGAADAASPPGSGSGPDASPGGAFPPGVGVAPAVDRTAACAAAEEGSFRNAPEDPEVVQACLPNVRAWAPVACGGPKPACACDATRCAPKEVAKLVSGSFCICLAPCAAQAQGATCGAGGTRKCVPVDDVARKQVFVCGGAR